MPSTLTTPVALIDKILPHNNADRLEIAHVLGWQCIVGIGEFTVGQKVVYFPPDTVLSETWLEKFGALQYTSKGRLRACRLRGEKSFGLVVACDKNWNVGDNVADYYKATKYEPPARGGGSGACGGKSSQFLAEHAGFPKFTDIENARHYPNMFDLDETVVVTEKIHGCVPSQSAILMADGTKKSISQIKVGDYVMGRHHIDGVCPSQVTKVFRNGPSPNGWVRVSGERRMCGRGSSKLSVPCTPNHRFWMPDLGQYKAAAEIEAGMRVAVYRSERILTPVQEQVLLGMLLGDGYLSVHPSDTSALVQWSHAAKDSVYCDWLSDMIGDLSSDTFTRTTSGYGTPMVRRCTRSDYAILRQFSSLVKDGVRRVPKWVASSLTPLALAVWYMDDGSLTHAEGQEDRASFATCRYNKEDCDVLVMALLRLGIKSQTKEYDYNRIVLDADNAERLFLLVAPYIIPVMQRKLPERYRGGPGWSPPSEDQYKPVLVPVTVTSVDPCKVSSQRYNIETETSNYFVNRTLTHNSNSRVGMVSGKWMAGSHGRRRRRPFGFLVAGEVDTRWMKFKRWVAFKADMTKMFLIKLIPWRWLKKLLRLHRTVTDGSDLYWHPLTLEPVANLIRETGKHCGSVTLYGEIYGPGIQGLAYGVEQGSYGYRAFDMKIDGKYLPWDDFHGRCTQYGVEHVPVLYRGPRSNVNLAEVSEGQTVLMGSNPHMREGVVVKPLVERTDPRVGRVVAKYVSDTYLLSKTKDFKEE